jgi:chromosome segregation ATPase
MMHSLTSSQEHNLVTLINLLQNENEELKCDVHTLSSRNASLHEELLNLREKLESYRELETVVVPELKSKLESARSSLSCVEHDMAKLRKSTSKDVDDLQQKLANAAIVEFKDNVDASLAASIAPSQQETNDPAFPTPSTLQNNEQSLVVAEEGEDDERVMHIKTSSDSSEHELWC